MTAYGRFIRAIVTILLASPATAVLASEPQPAAIAPDSSPGEPTDSAPTAQAPGPPTPTPDAQIVRHLLRDGEYNPDDVRPQPGATVGEITRCPVSGNVFVVTEGHPYVETDEGRLFVCCSRCVTAFDQNPDLFR